MKNDPTEKHPNWIYSDDCELDMAVYLLPHLWWSAAMYGRSLSAAYASLGRRRDEMVSGVAQTFYRHFLGSLLGMSFELALKGLLISLDDPPNRRVGFPKKHDLSKLWGLVPSDVREEVERDANERGVDGPLAEWFAEHGAFLSVEDRYPEKRANGRQKWKTSIGLLLPRSLSNDLIGQMEVIFDCIMEAMKRRYFSDEQAEIPIEDLKQLRAEMDTFDGLQKTRNRWSHLWGMPVVRPPNGTAQDATTFRGGNVVGYGLDVTLLEQGQEAHPRTVPRLWWIPVGADGLQEYRDADAFNSFVQRQIDGEAE